MNSLRTNVYICVSTFQLTTTEAYRQTTSKTLPSRIHNVGTLKDEPVAAS